MPNPAHRYPWLCGATPDRIGIRVPVLPASLAAALASVPAVLATSANRAGSPPALQVGDLDADGISVVVDGGASPGGVPSTVVDLCGEEPAILRAGPVGLDEIRSRL